MKDNSILESMFKTYGKSKIDWMGFPVTTKNYITYHHIYEARNGGIESENNGALLTRKAHEYLNIAYIIDRPLYDEYNYYFRIINDMKMPPSDEIMSLMYNLKKRLKKLVKDYENSKSRGYHNNSLEKAPNL
jgi:hypothetical protein